MVECHLNLITLGRFNSYRFMNSDPSSSTNSAQIVSRITEAGVLAVIRAASAEQAVEACLALLRGGIRGLEITYSTPNACHAITEVARLSAAGALPVPAVLGAGTVLTQEQAEAAIEAGADFLVSPCILPNIIEVIRKSGRAALPGAFTPTEIYTAHSLGADIVKVFPASRLGPGYLKDLKGPLPHIPVMPTGGVDASNAGQWLDAGAVALGAGSNLLPAEAMKNGDWDRVTELAHEMWDAVTRWRAAKSG